MSFFVVARTCRLKLKFVGGGRLLELVDSVRDRVDGNLSRKSIYR